MEFKKWPKTKRFNDVEMTITQKMDGSNAQILFEENPEYGYMWRAGSRNRWLTREKDNFGFHAWVSENSDVLYETLGQGRHYGEWCGPGIQTGEGLEERKFFSFNPYLNVDTKAKHLIQPVPLLYCGRIDMPKIWECVINLNSKGSEVNGFDSPEGVIVNISGLKMKVYCRDHNGENK